MCGWEGTGREGDGCGKSGTFSRFRGAVSAGGADWQCTTATVAALGTFWTEEVLQSGLKFGIVSVEKVMAETSSSARTSRQERSRRRAHPSRSFRPVEGGGVVVSIEAV